jgi:hypothetical protein
MAYVTIFAMAFESPPPLWLRDDLEDTSQQPPLLGLLGQRVMYPPLSEPCAHGIKEFLKYVCAEDPQEWITTTSAGFAFTLSGT